MRLIVMLILFLNLQGCLGIGAWVVGLESTSTDAPRLYRERGSVGMSSAAREGDISNSTELKRYWGEPDTIVAQEDGREEWIYKRAKWRWAGVILCAIVPLPLILPFGSESVSVRTMQGQIESVTRRRGWDVIAGGFCGFSMMMPPVGFGCTAGTNEGLEEQ